MKKIYNFRRIGHVFKPCSPCYITHN